MSILTLQNINQNFRSTTTNDYTSTSPKSSAQTRSTHKHTTNEPSTSESLETTVTQKPPAK